MLLSSSSDYGSVYTALTIRLMHASQAFASSPDQCLSWGSAILMTCPPPAAAGRIEPVVT